MPRSEEDGDPAFRVVLIDRTPYQDVFVGLTDSGEHIITTDAEIGSVVREPKVLCGRGFIALSACSQGLLGLTASGTVYTTVEYKDGKVVKFHDLHTRCGALYPFHPTPIKFGEGADGIQKVVCGSNHAIALTHTGHVFVWGRNTHGELGLGDTEARFEPVRLQIAPVADIEAGPTWTMLQLPNGIILRSGLYQDDAEDSSCCGSDDMPMGSERRGSVTRRMSRGSLSSVQGAVAKPTMSFLPIVIEDRRLSVSDNEDAVLVLSPPAPKRQRLGPIPAATLVSEAKPTLSLVKLQPFSQLSNTMTVEQYMEYTLNIIRRPSCINVSFLLREANEAHATLPTIVTAINTFHTQLTSLYNAASPEQAGKWSQKIRKALSSLSEVIRGMPSPSFTTPFDLISLLFALSGGKALDEPSDVHLRRRLIENAVHVARWLQPAAMKAFCNVLLPAAGVDLFSLLVRVARDNAAASITMEQGLHNLSGEALCNFMAVLFEVNEAEDYPVPASVFISDILSGWEGLAEHFRNTQVDPSLPKPLYTTVTPFMLSLKAKKRLLRKEIEVGRADYDTEFARQVGLNQRPMHVGGPVLYLSVRREHLLEDTQREIELRLEDVRKPMVVHFVGEQGLDDGALTKELLSSVIDYLIEKSEAFTLYDDAGAYWFTEGKKGRVSEDFWHVAGVVFGLALYHDVTLKAPFALPFYHKLLHTDAPPSMLKHSHPTLFRNLNSLRHCQVDGLRFVRTVTTEDGTVTDVPLKDGGEDIPVDSSNVDEYITLYSQAVLNGDVEGKFLNFSQGFHAVMGGCQLLSTLKASDLFSLVQGSMSMDLSNWYKYGIYQGCDANTPVVQWFWQLVNEFDGETRQKLLWFVTGIDRCPVGGPSSIPLTVQVTGDPGRLPTVSSCFRVLFLPPYASKDVLREKLLFAISETEGFYLY